MDINITNLDELKTFLSTHGESEDLKPILPVKQAELSVDSIKSFLSEKEDGKNYLQSIKDKHFSSSLETWKHNNLEKLIEDEVTKRFPNETPEQKEIRKLKQEIEAERQNRMMSELKIKAKQIAKDEELPFNLVDYFLGGDEEKTKENLTVLKNEFALAVDEAVKKRLGQEGYTPEGTGKQSNAFTYEQVLNMSQDELTANWSHVKHFFEGK